MNDRIILEATINGKSGKFYWDSGATWTVADVYVGNLPVIEDNFYFTSFDTTIKTKTYALNKLIVGGVKLETKSQLIKLPDHERDYLKQEGLDGVLSINIFEGYWCEISFSRQKIILYKEKPIKYTKSVPAECIDTHIDIPVMIDGETVYFLIDTGMMEALRFPQSIIKRKKPEEYMKVFSNDRVKESHLVRTYNINIFDQIFNDKYVLTNSYIAQNNQIPEEFENIGIIGTRFLRNYDLLLDLTEILNYKTTEIYYEPQIPPEERRYGFYSYMDNVPLAGIFNVIRRDDGAVVIHEILENCTAYKVFGLRPGMVITKINGINIGEINNKELFDPDFIDTVNEITVFENDVERVIRSRNS
jgi:hypothetical protein